MLFPLSERATALREKLTAFVHNKIEPREKALLDHWRKGAERWSLGAEFEALKKEARTAGLWNLFLPDKEHGAGLTNLEYAPLCEVMGRSHIAPEVFNCSAPDTGNMELLAMFGTAEQKQQWLQPLLDGEIRSSFAMTEPDVASSDATNIKTSIERRGGNYAINGRKWWITGAAAAECKLLIVLGLTNPDAEPHRRHSMVLVPIGTPGVKIVRQLTLMGYEEAPHGHCEIIFDNVTVPAENILLGEGRGFEMAQARLGPGRIHHCMRLVGLAERALEATCARAKNRIAFGNPLARNDITVQTIAECRMEIEQSRLLVLKTAAMMDTVGNKAARGEIAMIKVVVPRMAQRVVDRAIQIHGAGGLSDDYFLAHSFARTRAMRFADGPDEVHQRTVGRIELAKN